MQPKVSVVVCLHVCNVKLKLRHIHTICLNEVPFNVIHLPLVDWNVELVSFTKATTSSSLAALQVVDDSISERWSLLDCTVER